MGDRNDNRSDGRFTSGRNSSRDQRGSNPGDEAYRGYSDEYSAFPRSSNGSGAYSRWRYGSDSAREADEGSSSDSYSSTRRTRFRSTNRSETGKSASMRRSSSSRSSSSQSDESNSTGRRNGDFAGSRAFRTRNRVNVDFNETEASATEGQRKRKRKRDRASQSPDSRRRGAHASSSGESRRKSTRNATRSSSRTAAVSADSPDSTASAPRSSARDTAAPKKSSKRRTVGIVIAVALVVVLAGAGAAYAYMTNIAGNLHSGVNQDLRDALVQTDMAKEPFYILLLGTDKSSERQESDEFGGAFRSDSMMLVRVDPVANKVAMVTIPRDTLVDLGKGYGWNKINAAYAYGGPALAVEAVSKLAGVPISHYAEIDFNGFSAIVDAIGGVEVEVPIDMDDPDAGGSLKAGLQTLNGEQALILCRARNSYSEISAQPDLMRAANQRVVLSAIAHKLLDSDVLTIANTVRSVSDYVTTDLELNDIIGIAQTMKGLDSANDIYTASLPTEGVYIFNGHYYSAPESTESLGTVDSSIDEGWYMLLQEKEWKAMLARMEQGLPPSEGAVVDAATGTVLATAGADAEDISDKTCWITVANGTNREGLGSRAAKLLANAGYENVTIVNANAGYDYPETLIIYDEPGREHEAKMLAEALGQGKTLLNKGQYVVDNQYLIIVGDDWKNTSSSTGDSGGSDSSASASSSSSSSTRAS